MRIAVLLPALVAAGIASSAHAFEFRARWVERVGNVDTVIPGNYLSPAPGVAIRLRLQFGVFDDAAGAAPAGGFVGWNVGSIDISGPATNSTDRRTNGRLAPFTFATQPTANGNPPPAGGVGAGDAIGTDFEHWTDIDATLGIQSPFWGFDGDGNPLPPPPPTIRGRNTYVSVYEITTLSSPSALIYTIAAAGNLIAASEWRTVGTPVPPDPDIGFPGSLNYAPVPLPPVSFSTMLVVDPTPAPGSALLLLTGALAAARRRR